MATIDKLPGVYYLEDMTYESTGDGSKIPVFIGVTGNTNTTYTDNGKEYTYTVDGKNAIEYRDFNSINQTIPNKGILSADSNEARANNQLYNTIKEFFEESRLVNSGDIGVPHIYVIDVGDGKDKTAWTNAYVTAKKLLDVQIEVYDGAFIKKTNNSSKIYLTDKNGAELELTDFMADVMELNLDYSIRVCAENLDLRNVFTTIYGATDEDLMAYTDSLSTAQKYSRLGLIEPFLFGKHIARICCTPYYMEPGYYQYRSVPADTFKERTKARMLDLQKHGIIFGRDEHINGKVYPRMNLCVSTSFEPTKNRPADSLFHARFNADNLLYEVFEACYNQIKANESATNIAYLQTRINKIVNDRVAAEEMVKWNEKTERGTKLTVTESHEDPYALNVGGYILPIKSTIAIKVKSTIQL